MMTDDKKGIMCDTCGDEYREKFIYYSSVFDKVSVDSSQQKVGVVDADKRTLELDMCEKCYGDMTTKVREIINKRESKGSKKGKSGWSMK